MKMFIGLVFSLAFIALKTSAFAYDVDSKSVYKFSLSEKDFSGDTTFIFSVAEFTPTFSIQFIERVSVDNKCRSSVGKTSTTLLHKLARDSLRCS